MCFVLRQNAKRTLTYMWHCSSNSKPAWVVGMLLPSARRELYLQHFQAIIAEVNLTNCNFLYGCDSHVKNKNLSGIILEIKSTFLIALVWLLLCLSANICWDSVWDLPYFAFKKHCSSLLGRSSVCIGWSIPLKVLSVFFITDWMAWQKVRVQHCDLKLIVNRHILIKLGHKVR